MAWLVAVSSSYRRNGCLLRGAHDLAPRGLSTAGPGVLVFGQCTDNRSCDYLLLVTTFNDLINSPSDWVSAHNMEIDLGKVWVNGNGTLSYAIPVPAGGQDVPVAMMRYVFDQWAAVGKMIATSAIERGLIDGNIQPPLSNESS